MSYMIDARSSTRRLSSRRRPTGPVPQQPGMLWRLLPINFAATQDRLRAQLAIRKYT